jgi:hypothetical protein
MVTAQVLEATHTVEDKVLDVDNKVARVDDRVAGVDSNVRPSTTRSRWFLMVRDRF